MKILRVFLIALAVICLLAAVALIVGFNSGFQTWAARRAVASQPGMKADIGRVDVGLNAVKLENIRVVQSGIIFTLPSADLQLPVLDAASKKILLKNVVARGWTLDLTAPDLSVAQTASSTPTMKAAALNSGSPSKTAAAHVETISSTQTTPAEKAKAFEGIFGLLQLPVQLSIDQADLAGEIIFPTAPGEPPGHAKVTITGGQLGAGREGKFQVIAAAALTGAVTSLNARSDIAAHMDTPSSFDRINAVTDLTAVGAQFPNGAKLRSDLSAERGAQGAEEYHFIAESNAKKLVDLHAKLPAAGSRIDGTMTLAAQDTDLAPFALGLPLPTFSVTANSKFGANTRFTDLSADGSLELTASKLQAIQAGLEAVGTLKIDSTFAIEHSGDLLRVNALHLNVNGQKPVAVVDARQPFEFNLKTSELRVSTPEKELLAVKLEGLPLAWAQPFLKDLTVTGDDVRGSCVARAAGGGFSVKPESPITVTNVSVTSAGKPQLQAVDLSVNAGADVTPQAWQADISELLVRSAGNTFLTVSAKAGQATGMDQPLKATGHYKVNLPVALAQPAGAAFAYLKQGNAEGDFTASSAKKQEIAATLVLTDLVAKEINDPLPKISLDLRADLDPDGTFAAQAPLLVQQADRTSDLTFSAKGKTSPTSTSIDAKLVSNLVYLDDVKILLAGMSSPQGPETAPAPQTGPDQTPVWAGVSGQLSLALKKVVYSPELTVSDVGGSVKIGTSAVTLDGLRAVLGTGGELKVNGGVTFTAASPKPYELKADVAVSGLESGPALKAFAPSAGLPFVEGKFDLTSQVHASGANLGNIAEQAQGDVRLTSKGGIFRPIPSNYVEMFSSSRAQLVKRTEQAGAISSFAEALGAKLPSALGGTTNKVQLLADRMGDLEKIVKILAELKFDQFTLDLGGDTNLNTVLRDLTITAPELRFAGAGGLKYKPNVPLWKQDLSLKLDGAARGTAAEIMKKGNLLGEATDSLGYVPLSFNVEVGGTVENPDTSKVVADLVNKVLGVKLQPADVEGLKRGDLNVLLNLVGQIR